MSKDKTKVGLKDLSNKVVEESTPQVDESTNVDKSNGSTPEVQTVELVKVPIVLGDSKPIERSIPKTIAEELHKLEAKLVENKKEQSELRAKIRLFDDNTSDDLIDITNDRLNYLRIESNQARNRITAIKLDSLNEVINEDLTQWIKDNYPMVNRLTWECTKQFDDKGVEIVGKFSYKLELNEQVGKAKTSGVTSKGSKKTYWHNKTSGKIELASEVYWREFKGEVDGTANASAWSKVLESLHSKGKASQYELSTYNQS